MGKRIPVITVAEPAAAARLAELPVEATVALADVAGSIRDGLLAFASSTGLLVMHQLMEAELSARVGPKHARIPGRAGNWHGSTRGSVTLGGRKVAVTRPRARTTDGLRSPLDQLCAFAAEDVLDRVVMERMLARVATRRHARTRRAGRRELERRAKSRRARRSRGVRQATEPRSAELMARDLTGEDIGCSCSTASTSPALRRGRAGDHSPTAKKPVGLWEGSTENKTVVRALLADLVARGPVRRRVACWS